MHKTFSEVLKSRSKPVSAAASCPKVSTVLLSKTQCMEKGKNQLTLSMKGKYKANGEKQSLSVYSSSRPDQISNDTTQCSGRLFLACKQQSAHHNSTSACSVECHSLNSPPLKHRSLTTTSQSSNASIPDKDTSANKDKLVARPNPSPKISDSSPDLLTIISSKTSPSQQLLPIETFFVTHKSQSHSPLSSSEKLLDTFSQLPPETIVKAHIDSDAEPFEEDSAKSISFDSEVQMEVELEGQADFDHDHDTMVIDPSFQAEALDNSCEFTTSRYLQSFPFPLLSLSWYRNRGKLSTANKCRENIRHTSQLQFSQEGKPTSLQRSQVEGTVEENIHQLHHLVALSGCASRKRFLRTVICLAEYIKQCGLLVRTQEVLDMYYNLNRQLSTTEKQKPHSRMNVGTFYEIISKYLNIAQIYIDGKAYLLQNMTCDFGKLVETISSAVTEQSIVNSPVSEQLQCIYPLVLRYADTE